MKHVNTEPSTLGELEFAKKNGLQLGAIINLCARQGYLLGDYFYYESISPSCHFWKAKRDEIIKWRQV